MGGGLSFFLSDSTWTAMLGWEDKLICNPKERVILMDGATQDVDKELGSISMGPHVSLILAYRMLKEPQ